MGQGELFALSKALSDQLLSYRDEAKILDVVSDIEATWKDDQRLPCGKEWCSVHYCLTGGTHDPKGGLASLNKCLLGTYHLLDPDAGYIAALLPSEEVPTVAAALNEIDGAWVRQRFITLFSAQDTEPIPDTYLDILSSLFNEIRLFYRRTAEGGQAVLFTTDEILNQVYRM